MPVVTVSAQLSVEDLMTAVKQLSPAEWSDFMRQVAEWQNQNGAQAEHVQDEARLIERIKKNSRLPAAEQRRFNHLRRKRQAETLTSSEETQLQALWQCVEQMNVARLEALIELAQRRNTDVEALMRELGLSENRDVF